MAGFLGIARKRCAFYRKRKFLESAEHIYPVARWFLRIIEYNKSVIALPTMIR